MLPDLPDHSPDCRPREGFCAPDCERYDVIMADAQWGRRQPPQVYPDDLLNNGTRSMEMLGLVIMGCAIAIVWFVVGLAIGAWLL